MSDRGTDPIIPTRTLFGWAQEKDLSARHAAAIQAVKQAQYQYRNAPRGRKSKAEATLRKAVHRAMALEHQIINRTHKMGTDSKEKLIHDLEDQVIKLRAQADDLSRRKPILAVRKYKEANDLEARALRLRAGAE